MIFLHHFVLTIFFNKKITFFFYNHWRIYFFYKKYLKTNTFLYAFKASMKTKRNSFY